MEKFLGTWQFVRAERLDEFMVACGLNVLMRTMASQMRPLITFTYNDETAEYTQAISTAFMLNKVNFKLDTEFEYDEPLTQQRQMATVSMEGDKMVMNTKSIVDGREIKVVREINDNQFTQKMYTDAVECTRVFERISDDLPKTPFEA